MENFNNLDLPSEIISALDRMNIKSPTEIQKQAIPIAMLGGDILASSQTGSGKTLAYLLPIISSIIKTKGKALVLVPTRELATQVRESLNKMTIQFRISSVVLIGGAPMHPQMDQLRRNPEVIVGTPGRIIDHLMRGTLKLSSVNVVVLDEMDRMLDMGMKEQLEEITKHVPEKKQVLMFSATMPKHIIELSQKYVINPKRISVGSTTKAAVQITQETLRISEREKFPELIKQLNERVGSVIVFVKTKRGADQLAKMLKAEEHKAEAIHGDLNQNRRDKVLLSFRNSNNSSNVHHYNKCRILVATDVAARGLDVDHVEHVINYNLPMCAEDYLHRIGRTGRAGKEGKALSFISPEEAVIWRAIDRLMTQGESTKREDMRAGLKDRKKSFGAPKKNFFGRNDNNNSSRKKPSSWDNRRQRAS
jgi:superfamily II DNA/RNA helicase